LGGESSGLGAAVLGARGIRIWGKKMEWQENTNHIFLPAIFLPISGWAEISWRRMGNRVGTGLKGGAHV